ncbi:MAG: hypothetical protein E7637_00125 [Ruminococcaceae bacterium]|nr:hypothetical protein [Oscillospiraceae bacterium]
MFFNPRTYQKLSDQPIAITPKTEIEILADAPASYLKTMLAKEFCADAPKGSILCRKLTFLLGIPLDVRAKIEMQNPVSGNEEEYAVVVGEESYVYATTEKGLLYGLATLIQLKDWGELSPCLLYDYPDCAVRGFRVYMPGRETIGIFKDMIDLLVYYKYNSIILEIGGAMEYKKHPEINEKWVEFCDDMRRFSGRAAEMQAKYPYMKNSVHCENGDGGYLTQEECRDIAAYCRERGLDIIPECPTLSHADYLLLPHPEFAERENDAVPDCYCPNHPGVYQYVFEVLDEVIDVFQPKCLHIGHDEFYSMCICDRCKGKEPVDVYVNDVKVLSDYLAAKGIETMMWGEKLLKAISPKGKHYGGWYDEKDYNGIKFKVPDMYQCAEKMPKNVNFLNWYWSFGTHLDRVYHDHGYKMLFGNFDALGCEDYRQRINWGCRGGFVSNWGSNESEYMQRNGCYFLLVSTAYIFWSAEYDSPDCNFVSELTMDEAYRMFYKGKKNLIRVWHNADTYLAYHPFWCGTFIEDDVYLLGHYRMTYTDGTAVEFPVKYGTNVSSSMDVKSLENTEYDPESGSQGTTFREVSCSTRPRLTDAGAVYETAYQNPYPHKTVESFRYVPCKGKENITVNLFDVKYE